jgi:putative (di)nucleoside polyphosphate hydrolase
MLSGVPLIDAEGYRANVGIVIINDRGQVFWARRFGQHSWQYPQGGVDEGESAEQTMYRELDEEVGLKPEHVKIVATTKNWLRYKLPKRLIRHESLPVCIGQKQKWFLLQLTAPESAVDLLHSNHPEFDDWRWVSYWYPVRQVVSFKREVYRKVMKEFALAAMPSHRQERRRRRV